MDNSLDVKSSGNFPEASGQRLNDFSLDFVTNHDSSVVNIIKTTKLIFCSNPLNILSLNAFLSFKNLN